MKHNAASAAIVGVTSNFMMMLPRANGRRRWKGTLIAPDPRIAPDPALISTALMPSFHPVTSYSSVGVGLAILLLRKMEVRHADSPTLSFRSSLPARLVFAFLVFLGGVGGPGEVPRRRVDHDPGSVAPGNSLTGAMPR
jgi:hypothetical protein